MPEKKSRESDPCRAKPSAHNPPFSRSKRFALCESGHDLLELQPASHRVTEAVEQHKLDPLAGAFFVELEGVHEALVARIRRHRNRQTRRHKQRLDPTGVSRRQSGMESRQSRRDYHPDRHRFAVQIMAVALRRFERVADGMAEIQNRPQTAFALIAL